MCTDGENIFDGKQKIMTKMIQLRANQKIDSVLPDLHSKGNIFVGCDMRRQFLIFSHSIRQLQAAIVYLTGIRPALASLNEASLGRLKKKRTGTWEVHRIGAYAVSEWFDRESKKYATSYVLAKSRGAWTLVSS
jgi:hypothetical protein